MPLISSKMVSFFCLPGYICNFLKKASDILRMKLGIVGNALLPIRTYDSTFKCSNRTSIFGNSRSTAEKRRRIRSNNFSGSFSTEVISRSNTSLRSSASSLPTWISL
uniref:Uncharacterized protein n=1 Tax=Opuntia streptacantha TaxID=393608 RepID=A0A7C9ALI2_OPUST